MKNMRTTFVVVLTFLSFILFSPPAQATKIGIVMDDHSGPEYYPAQPDGNQCVACDQGQPYTDGYDHSADGYFAMKYFMAHMVNVNGAIPGFVANSLAPYAGDQGIILMDKSKPETIVSGTPTLIDAWGKEGIYVSTAVPGADPATGYITYTKLYTDFIETDGTHLYVWPQPYPYPTGDPAYPDTKSAWNDGAVPFYLLPRDVMNAFEDTTFNGGTETAAGYGPWNLPAGAHYLEGPLEDPAGSGHFYPDNKWKKMLGWGYDLKAPDFFSTITSSNTVNAWDEGNFWEFAGLDTYASWLRKGGREVYMQEVTGQMNQVKDWIWTHYSGTLTGGPSGNKDDYIKVTYMIDPCYCNGENPANNIHGRSLYNAVYDLITKVKVDKIIVNDHFILQSQMMNDDMGWHMIMEAIDDANKATGGSFSMDNDLIFAPGHPMMGGDPMMSPYMDYYMKFLLGAKPVRQLAKCGGQTGPTWSSPPYPDRNMWVGGVALRPEYIAEVVTKAVSELNWAAGKGAADIAMFMSNHGTPTDASWCYDTANDYLHYNNKLAFILSTEAILKSSGFTSAFGSIASKNYEPYALSNAEITDLADLSDNNDLPILDHDIQVCKVTLSAGKKIVFYRVSGQNAYDSSDSGHLVYSPREAIDNILTVLNPAGWNVTHVVDLLYNFMGQSGDLLWDQRVKGYGEALSKCSGSSPDAKQLCAEEQYLENLALVYSNPIIDDASNPNSWKNFLSTPEQFCYPPDAPYSGNPCWDFAHNNPSCPDGVPDGCYVSYFSVYDSPSTPIPPGAVVPTGGLKIKITNGSWGWNGKVLSTRNMISEVLDQYFGGPTKKICPFVALTEDQPGAANVLREFRDKVLVKAPAGREYVNMFYSHSLELTSIILKNPSIKSGSTEVISSMLPKVKSAADGKGMIITSEQMSKISSLLNAIGKEAGPKLQEDIQRLKQDLSKMRIFKELNIRLQNS